MAGEEVTNFYAGAVNYADAAQIVLSSSASVGRDGLILPTHTLIGIAIELCFKAVILHRDGDAEELKKLNIRHNLIALRDLASTRGFKSGVTQIDDIIATISDNYAAHEYRYMKSNSSLRYVFGNAVMPSIQNLINEVASEVGLPVRPPAGSRRSA